MFEDNKPWISLAQALGFLARRLADPIIFNAASDQTQTQVELVSYGTSSAHRNCIIEPLLKGTRHFQWLKAIFGFKKAISISKLPLRHCGVAGNRAFCRCMEMPKIELKLWYVIYYYWKSMGSGLYFKSRFDLDLKLIQPIILTRFLTPPPKKKTAIRNTALMRKLSHRKRHFHRQMILMKVLLYI